MKKIINNRLYNTETARKIGYASSNRPANDFAWWGEELYLKRTGEYFLYGEGGPMSKYAVTYGDNNWGGGEEIIPLSYEKAREWAEENLDADDYISAFGEPSEGSDENVVLSICTTADTARRIRTEASKRGCSVSALITDLAKSLEV